MMTLSYANKVETTLSEFTDHLDRLARAIKALAAANEGMCAAINADTLSEGDGIATLYDILLAEMQSHTDDMQRILHDLNPMKSTKG